jgi:ubiquinol-cytochrome c reductase cytochrome b subunit
MAFQEKEVPADASVAQKLMAWVDSSTSDRGLQEHMSEYYAPKNLNFFYIFGALRLLF